MKVTSEQLEAVRKANVEAILSLATTQFAAMEKFANLNASVIKAAFQDSIANARALAGARNLRELLNLQDSFAQPALAKAFANSKGAAENGAKAGKDRPEAKSGRSRFSAKRRSTKKAAPGGKRKSR